MFPWLAILFLIAANALYVAAEFAAVSLHASRLKPLAEKGNRLARLLLHHVVDGHRLDRYIAACQVGITWSSLVLGAYGQAAFSPSLSGLVQGVLGLSESPALTVSVLFILITLTVTQMIFGELIPKSLALHDPLRTGLVTVLPMQWSLWLYSGFIKVLNGSGLFLLKLLGHAPTGHRHIHSPKELGLLLTESGKGGQLARHEEERLQGALKLSERPVKHLMTPRFRMQAIRRDTPPEAVLEEVLNNPYTRIPVMDEDGNTVVGLVYTQDILKAYLDGGKAPSLAFIMRPVLYVPEQMTADKLYVFLREHAAHIVMVVDEFGSAVGLVTLDDLMAEMLGDMPDEFKQGGVGSERLPDGRIRFAGLARVEEVEPFMARPWDGESATLAGMILETLGRMPQERESVSIGEMELEAERVEGNVIASVLVKPALAEESEAKRG